MPPADRKKPARRLKSKGRRLVQYAALPLLVPSAGKVRIALITSRETQRWVIPKGWPMGKRRPSDVAAKEALEEAGLSGGIARKQLGRFSYDKRLKTGKIVRCNVQVFALDVTHQWRAWKEMEQRTVQWFEPEVAASLVDERGLARIIAGFCRDPIA